MQTSTRRKPYIAAAVIDGTLTAVAELSVRYPRAASALKKLKFAGARLVLAKENNMGQLFYAGDPSNSSVARGGDSKFASTIPGAVKLHPEA